MTEITEGVWFAYQLTVSCGGRNHKDPSIEKYTIVKIDGDDVTVQREVDGAGADVHGNQITGERLRCISRIPFPNSST